jgi:hypothetical protein
MPSTNTIRRRSARTAALAPGVGRRRAAAPILPATSFPAVDGDTLLVGSAAAGFAKKPKFQLIAYSLS